MGREAEDQQSDEKRPQSRQRRHNHSWCHERCPFLRINPAANVVKLIAMDEEPNATSMVVPATNRSSSGNTAHRTLNSKTRCTVDVKRLACSTSPGASCLSPAQVESAAKMYAGAGNPRTKEPIFPGVAPGSELGWDPVNGLQPFPIAESHFRHVVFNDVDWDYRTLDFDANIAASDKVAGALRNAIDPNLQPFFARGGKLIQYHGWNDQQISPFNSVNYYKSVEARLGGRDKIDKSYRLFMAPGMMHCGGGEGPNQFNPMSALERWRESDVAPDQILATHVSNGVVDSTRPLRPYPRWRCTRAREARGTQPAFPARRRRRSSRAPAAARPAAPARLRGTRSTSRARRAAPRSASPSSSLRAARADRRRPRPGRA